MNQQPNGDEFTGMLIEIMPMGMYQQLNSD